MTNQQVRAITHLSSVPPLMLEVWRDKLRDEFLEAYNIKVSLNEAAIEITYWQHPNWECSICGDYEPAHIPNVWPTGQCTSGDVNMDDASSMYELVDEDEGTDKLYCTLKYHSNCKYEDDQDCWIHHMHIPLISPTWKQPQGD